MAEGWHTAHTASSPTSLRRTHIGALEDLAALTKENERLRSELAGVKGAYNAAGQQEAGDGAGGEAALRQAAARAAAAEAEAAELRADAVTLGADCEGLRGERDRLQSEARRLHGRCQRLERQCTAPAAAVEALERKLADAESASAAAAAAAREEVGALRAQLAAAKGEADWAAAKLSAAMEAAAAREAQAARTAARPPTTDTAAQPSPRRHTLNAAAQTTAQAMGMVDAAELHAAVAAARAQAAAEVREATQVAATAAAAEQRASGARAARLESAVARLERELEHERARSSALLRQGAERDGAPQQAPPPGRHGSGTRGDLGSKPTFAQYVSALRRNDNAAAATLWQRRHAGLVGTASDFGG